MEIEEFVEIYWGSLLIKEKIQERISIDWGFFYE